MMMINFNFNHSDVQLTTHLVRVLSMKYVPIPQTHKSHMFGNRDTAIKRSCRTWDFLKNEKVIRICLDRYDAWTKSHGSVVWLPQCK